MSIRKFVAATTLLAGALAAGTAHAGPDVQWQVTLETPKIRLPGHVVLPLPPIPVPRAVVVAPQRDARDHGRGYEPSHGNAHSDPRRWDADRDGIPNRYDRVYNPRWDRDGDGIPNRHDRGYNPRWDRDGDGVPNRHDRHDDRRDGGRHGR